MVATRRYLRQLAAMGVLRKAVREVFAARGVRTMEQVRATCENWERLVEPAGQRAILDSIWARIISAGIGWIAATPSVFWAVIAVTAVKAWPPSMVTVLMSA